MGGIVIDIREKSNFFWSFGSQKGAFKSPPFMVGLTFIFNPITNRVSVSFRLRNTLIIDSFIISFKRLWEAFVSKCSDPKRLWEALPLAEKQ